MPCSRRSGTRAVHQRRSWIQFSRLPGLPVAGQVYPHKSLMSGGRGPDRPPPMSWRAGRYRSRSRALIRVPALRSIGRFHHQDRKEKRDQRGTASVGCARCRSRRFVAAGQHSGATPPSPPCTFHCLGDLLLGCGGELIPSPAQRHGHPTWPWSGWMVGHGKRWVGRVMFVMVAPRAWCGRRRRRFSSSWLVVVMVIVVMVHREYLAGFQQCRYFPARWYCRAYPARSVKEAEDL